MLDGHEVGAVRRLGLAIAAWLAATAPVQAIDYGGWNARASLDSWYDDNLTRGLAVSADTLANGDVGLHLGASVGNVWLLTPDLDAWLIVDLHGSYGLNYPTLSDAWGSLVSNTVWHLNGGREAALMLGTSAFWGSGNYHAASLDFRQPLWAGASVHVEGGASTYRTDVDGASFWMPSAGGGLDQAFPTGTLVGLRYAYQPRFYEAAVAPRHQGLLRASQRFGSWELHASILETVDTSSNGFQEGYFGCGVAYDL